MPGVGLVAAGHDECRRGDRLEIGEGLERVRAWHDFERVGNRLRILVCAQALAEHRLDGRTPRVGHGVEVVGAYEALDPALAQPSRERVPTGELLLVA